jgi:Pentapeptide repeats (9 copies)
MKNLLFFMLIAFGSASLGQAQSVVSASEVIAKINRNESVSYQNATINGDLDLTELANKRRNALSNWGGKETYLSMVTVPISFKNCTFSGNVIAYKGSNGNKNDETSLLSIGNVNIVSTADFKESVTFENCTFNKNAAFKYTTFGQSAVFVNTNFRNIALFKYAHFNESADFGGSSFGEYADFKYAKFSSVSGFQKVQFNGPADFKYTNFNEKTDFGQARFIHSANFKYTNLPAETRFDETEFKGLADFKYTKLGGKRFSPK